MVTYDGAAFKLGSDGGAKELVWHDKIGWNWRVWSVLHVAG